MAVEQLVDARLAVRAQHGEVVIEAVGDVAVVGDVVAADPEEAVGQRARLVLGLDLIAEAPQLQHAVRREIRAVAALLQLGHAHIGRRLGDLKRQTVRAALFREDIIGVAVRLFERVDDGEGVGLHAVIGRHGLFGQAKDPADKVPILIFRLLSRHHEIERAVLLLKEVYPICPTVFICCGRGAQPCLRVLAAQLRGRKPVDEPFSRSVRLAVETDIKFLLRECDLRYRFVKLLRLVVHPFEQQRPHIVRVPVRNDFQLAPDGIIHIAGCAGDGRFLNIVLSKGLGKLRILPAAGEGAGDRKPRDEQHGDRRIRRGLRLLHQQGNALLEPLAAVGHHRGGDEQRGALFTGHADQRAAVGGALALADAADGRLVTGQLRVAAGKLRRPPHERVVPMQRQTHAAQHRPKVVTVAVVRLLVGERVAQRLRLRARVGCDVNARLRHAEQARRIRLTALVDRQAGVGLLHALTRAAQLLAEAQVHGEEHQSQRRRAGEPDGFCDPRPVGLFDRRRGHRRGRDVLYEVWRSRLVHALRRNADGTGVRGRVVPLADDVLPIDALLHGRRALGHGVHHAQIARAEAHRNEQAHEHQQPQGVLHPQAELPAQHIAQRDDHQNQNAG